MTNKELKQYAKDKGVKLWQVAYELGFTDATFTKKMRCDLNDEQKRIFIEIVDKLSLGIDINEINDKRKAYRMRKQQEKAQLRKRDINKVISIGESINELTTFMVELNNNVQKQIQAIREKLGEEE